MAQDFEDHPRLCGEKPDSFHSKQLHAGSPPPMRGKVYNSSRVEQRNRITPAYAGKRGFRFFRCSGFWDHPRLCGEKLNCRRIEHHDEGSPPPMRGKVNSPLHHNLPNGITPAYAGKRLHSEIYGRKYKDHPRLCGEKLLLSKIQQIAAGSPPPMRGKD